MLPLNTILNGTCITEITEKGYSRIPIYMDRKEKVVGMLHVKVGCFANFVSPADVTNRNECIAKDLTMVNPNESMPLKSVLEKKKRPLVFTYKEEKLFILLNCMKQGRSHLAIVKETSDLNSPAVGVVTLEDIIEEILQTEIADETDIQGKNLFELRSIQNVLIKLTCVHIAGGHRIKKESYPHVNRIAPNHWQWMALMHYLSEEVDLFKAPLIHRNILKRLLSQKVFFLLKVDGQKGEPIHLIVKEQPCDYFILILEGKVEVEIGNERLKFEAGSFTNFALNGIRLSTDQITQIRSWLNTRMAKEGSKSPEKKMQSTKETTTSIRAIGKNRKSKSKSKYGLANQIENIVNKSTYIPDYSLRVLETTFYMKIHRLTYAAAFCASQAIVYNRPSVFVTDLQNEIDRQIELSSTPFPSRHTINQSN